MEARVAEVVLIVYHLREVGLFRNIEVLFRKQLDFFVPILGLNNVSVHVEQHGHPLAHRLVAPLQTLEVEKGDVVHLFVALVHAFKQVSAHN